MSTRANEKGGALLMVLWLSAALTVIAFSVATTVRGETERTSTHMDQTRAYYMATGAVDRALLWTQYGPGYRRPDGTPMFYEYGMPLLSFNFPAGVAMVEMIPESSKLSANQSTPVELAALFVAMGLLPERAQELAMAIVDWRTPSSGPSAFDQFYMSMGPTFRARHASLEQIEELLYIKGVTPELFYGTWTRDARGALVRLPGLKDCLTVYGSNSAFDINTVQLPVMLSMGVPADVAAAIVQRRAQRPFLIPADVNAMLASVGPAAGRLRVGGNSIYTLRSTATIRQPGTTALSDVRRTVAAVVKFNRNIKNDNTPYWILRWYDNAGTN